MVHDHNSNKLTHTYILYYPFFSEKYKSPLTWKTKYHVGADKSYPEGKL
jgi:hypothetical protein